MSAIPTYAFPDAAAAYIARQSGRCRARATTARSASLRAMWTEAANRSRALAHELLAANGEVTP